jgi:SSS family solute:Na+ symporter
MSSGDSILHSAASIGIRDGLAALLPGRFDDQSERTGIRVLVVVLSLVAFYFAVVSSVSLVDLLLAAYGGVAQIMPPVLAALYWRRATGAGAIAGLVGGLAVNVLFLTHPELKPIAGLHEGIYGLAVNVPLLLGVSLATRPDPEELVRKYVDA